MKIIRPFLTFKYFLILFLFIPAFLFSEGFSSGTLVKSELGYIPIEQLQVGDRVLAFDNISGEYILQPVTHRFVCSVDQYCKLSFKNHTISCAPDQRFFSVSSGRWVRAQELCVSDLLRTGQGTCVEVQCIEQINQKILLYSITVANLHTFSVTSADLHAHNFIPVVLIGAAWAFGGGIEFLGLSAAVTTAIGIAFGITALKKKSGGFKTQCTVTPTHSAPSFSGGFPEDPDKERKKNSMTKQEFFQSVSQDYEHYRNGIYHRKGKSKGIGRVEYLQWDHLHNDVEVFDKNGFHLGSLDPRTKELCRSADCSRRLIL